MNNIIRVLSLSAVAFAGLSQFSATRAQDGAQKPEHVIEITAKRFEFAPKEITLQKGEPVTLRLKSDDVDHGFFVRPLKIDSEIPAGKSVDVAVTPATVGKFTTICDHFCGTNHGNMKMTINVVE
jgi:cytochrome c oxidase subunit 2